MATIDVRGLACPAPLIKTKQALDKAEAGSTLQIVGNGEIPFGNLKNYLKELGIAYKETREELPEGIGHRLQGNKSGRGMDLSVHCTGKEEGRRCG